MRRVFAAFTVCPPVRILMMVPVFLARRVDR
jgi:hypothetical protein